LQPSLHGKSLISLVSSNYSSHFTTTVCFNTSIAITVVPKLIKCPICNKGIKDPKTLPCLHSFCQKCLEKNEFDMREKPRCEVCQAPYDGAKDLTAYDCADCGQNIGPSCAGVHMK